MSWPQCVITWRLYIYILQTLSNAFSDKKKSCILIQMSLKLIAEVPTDKKSALV